MACIVKYDFMIFWGKSSSSSNWDILIFLIELQSFALALFTDFYKQFSFNQFFMPKTLCSWVYLGDFCIFHCVNPYSIPCPPQLLLSRHLGFGLELISLTYWPTSQIRKTGFPGISIEKINAGIGIPASISTVWYQTKKIAGLHRHSLVSGRSRHR